MRDECRSSLCAALPHLFAAGVPCAACCSQRAHKRMRTQAQRHCSQWVHTCMRTQAHWHSSQPANASPGCAQRLAKALSCVPAVRPHEGFQPHPQHTRTRIHTHEHACLRAQATHTRSCKRAFACPCVRVCAAAAYQALRRLRPRLMCWTPPHCFWARCPHCRPLSDRGSRQPGSPPGGACASLSSPGSGLCREYACADCAMHVRVGVSVCACACAGLCVVCACARACVGVDVQMCVCVFTCMHACECVCMCVLAVCEQMCIDDAENEQMFGRGTAPGPQATQRNCLLACTVPVSWGIEG